MQHIDRPDANWTNPPHKIHLCRRDQGGCGHIWAPANIATMGVEQLWPSAEPINEFDLAQLRHAYQQLYDGTVKQQRDFADGLIAPIIRKLELLL